MHVILIFVFVSDWNPHADSQAMDRCHRLGQTNTVMVYRLATANTVEMKVLESANAKRKLERIVVNNKEMQNKLTNRKCRFILCPYLLV